MIQLGRRSFLQSIIALAVVAAAPSLPATASQRLQEQILKSLSGLLINGSGLKSISVAEEGGGWFRVIARCDETDDGSLDLNFNGVNDGKGLWVGTPELIDWYLRENPGDLACTQMTIGNEMKFEMRLKLDQETV